MVAKYIGTARFRDQTLLASMYGLLGMNEKKKESRIRIEDYQNDLTQKKSRGIRINPDSLKCFTETIDYLVEQGVTVVLLGIPTLDLLNNTAPQDRDSVFALFTKISNNHKNVLYFNYNKDYESDHKLFYDLRHLNKYGNAVVTDRLIRDLRLMTTSNNQQ